MNDVDVRLKRCFAVAFPSVPPDAIPRAEQASVEGWDSVAAITLVALIEEEFAITVDLDQLPELTSFAAIRRYLDQTAA
jgi:acyl carrier protein